MTVSKLDKILDSAQQLRVSGDINAAIELIIEAIEIAPSSLGILAILGFWLFEAHRYNEAIPILEELVKEKPKKEDASRALFHCLFNTLQVKKAFNEMKRFLAISHSVDYEFILLRHAVRYGFIKSNEKMLNKDELLSLCDHMGEQLCLYYEKLNMQQCGRA
jgi:tetratricopeptide (TPR) repeat protein